MTSNNHSNVFAAFEMLLEEVEAEVEVVNRTGAAAFQKGDHSSAQKALQRAERLTTFREKVTALAQEWETIAPRRLETAESTGHPTSTRLQNGQRTPKPAYFKPILQALVELGGSVNMNDVLDRVGQLMSTTLRSVDYEPISSDPDTVRWSNAAQWARYELVKKGWLQSGSPRGIWEISEEGRRALAEGLV